MTCNEKYKYWEMLADYDIETVQVLIGAKRWIYVASLCYTAIGRMIKGLTVCCTKKEAPKSDNLIFLMNKLCDNEKMREMPGAERFLDERKKYFDMLVDITYYHINDYPFSYQKVMDRFISEDAAMKVYNDSCEIIRWMKQFGAECTAQTE